MRDGTSVFDALDRKLTVKTKPVGRGFGPKFVEFSPLYDDINVAYDGRVVELVSDEWICFIEADHRGPEHGVDAWLSPNEDDEDPTPRYVVEDIVPSEEVDDD